MSCSADTWSTVVLHGLPGDNLHHHGLLQELQGTFCWGTCSTSSPPAALPSGLAGLFLTLFFPHSSLPGSVLPFLTHVFPKAPPSWLRGSAVPCGGSSGASWSQLEPVVSGLGQPQPLLTEAPAAPHCQCLGTRTRYSIIQSEPNSSVTTRPTLSRAADSS